MMMFQLHPHIPQVKEHFHLEGAVGIQYGARFEHVFMPRDLPRPLKALRVSHGDMLQYTGDVGASVGEREIEAEKEAVVRLDDVDEVLYKKDGLVLRGKDATM